MTASVPPNRPFEHDDGDDNSPGGAAGGLAGAGIASATGAGLAADIATGSAIATGTAAVGAGAARLTSRSNSMAIHNDKNNERIPFLSLNGGILEKIEVIMPPATNVTRSVLNTHRRHGPCHI